MRRHSERARERAERWLTGGEREGVLRSFLPASAIGAASSSLDRACRCVDRASERAYGSRLAIGDRRTYLANYVRSRRRCAVGHNCSLRMRSLSFAFLPPPSSLYLHSPCLSFLITTFPPLLHMRALACRAKPRCLSLSLSRPRETPRCISSIFKRHGPSARVAQPLYIKRQGACFSRPPFSRAVRGAEVSIEHRVYARGSVTESISCRRAAFYLRYPSPSSVLRPPSSALRPLSSACTRSLSFRPLAISLSIPLFSPFSATFYVLRSPFSSPPLRHPPSLSSTLVTRATAGGCSLACCYP